MNNSHSRTGLACALGAFGLWGFMPVYIKALGSVPPLEVLGHRVLWSAVLLLLVFWLTGKLHELLAIFKSPRTMAVLCLSALLVSINWLTFIWGVTNDRILETSLGYFINPLVSVLFGVVLLGERPNRVQWVAVMLAAVAVILRIALLGKVPWVAFTLALSFGLYGLVRKTLEVKAAVGLAVETLLILPLVLGYFYWLWASDEFVFVSAAPDTVTLLLIAGVITTVPLVLFNQATRMLSLTLVGITQYLCPTISFLMGVVIYKEPLGSDQLLTFVLIWVALVIFTVDGIFRRKRLSTEDQGNRLSAQQQEVIS